MTTNIHKYWERVREARSELEPDGPQPGKVHYMTSLANDDGAPAGVVTPMSLESAARAIASQRARQATDEELKEFEMANAKARQSIAAAESLRLRNDIFNPRFVNPAGSK